MTTVFKSRFYKIVRLTLGEARALGGSAPFAVLDTFFDNKNVLANVCQTFITRDEAEAWIAEHE